MSTISVVNIKTANTYDVYCGRGSAFGNPFIMGRDGNRAEVIAKYKEYFYQNPLVKREAARLLANKVCACYCSPLPCHLDIIKEYIESL